MLIFDEVFVTRAGRGLFQPVSFALKPGEIMTLQGESGLGKDRGRQCSSILLLLFEPRSILPRVFGVPPAFVHVVSRKSSDEIHTCLCGPCVHRQ